MECCALFTNTVDHYVAVNITGSVVTIFMCADDRLMTGKSFRCKSHPEDLSLLGSQSVVTNIFRSEAHDVVMSLDLIEAAVSSEECICCLAFIIERVWIAMCFSVATILTYHFFNFISDVKNKIK